MSNEIMNIGGVDCYEEEDGTVYLRLETVARGLGFTQIAHSGNEVVRWERVDKYLKEITSVPTSGDDGKRIEYIPESTFYRLAMKAKNEVAEKFQVFIAEEVIPSIRKTGSYSVKQPVQKEEPSLREQAMFNNSCARMDKMSIEKAKTWMLLGEKFGSIPEFKHICASYAGEALAGKPVLSLPEVEEHTYTATEVGKMLGGISANKVWKLANKYSLKIPEYGKYVWDKSRYSDEQVETWRYNDKGIEALRSVLNQEENYN